MKTVNDEIEKVGKPPDDMREWVRQVVGTWQYLERLAKASAVDGDKWTRGQAEGYTERLKILLSNPPRIPSRAAWRRMEKLLYGRHI